MQAGGGSLIRNAWRNVVRRVQQRSNSDRTPRLDSVCKMKYTLPNSPRALPLNQVITFMPVRIYSLGTGATAGASTTSASACLSSLLVCNPAEGSKPIGAAPSPGGMMDSTTRSPCATPTFADVH